MKNKIDKSILTFAIRKKINDKAYLKSYKDSLCMASRNGIDFCGKPSVAAHCRAGEVAGMGTKPSDDLTWPLCWECHSNQESQPGAEWWLEHVLKPMMRQKYFKWVRTK